IGQFVLAFAWWGVYKGSTVWKTRSSWCSAPGRRSAAPAPGLSCCARKAVSDPLIGHERYLAEAGLELPHLSGFRFCEISFMTGGSVSLPHPRSSRRRLSQAGTGCPDPRGSPLFFTSAVSPLGHRAHVHFCLLQKRRGLLRRHRVDVKARAPLEAGH